MSDQPGGIDAAPPAGIPPTVIGTDPLHPGPDFAPIPAALVQQLINHARAEYPNEACGLIVGDRPAPDGGVPLRFEPTRNVSGSPYRYEIHPDDLLRLTIETDDAGEAFWGIVHSHTHTPARPSPTDTGLAFYPEALYVLVSLSPDEAEPSTVLPSVRAWRIIDGDEFEVELRVTT
ncbi:MAG: M67 family metallopeptidase [Chloroflexota bacterium]